MFYERLLSLVIEPRTRNAELERIVGGRAAEIAELVQRLAADTSNSSRPPSWDATWNKEPARKRSSWTWSGCSPGKRCR
jgi:hypothetical protein